jgi:hypothetical protein
VALKPHACGKKLFDINLLGEWPRYTAISRNRQHNSSAIVITICQQLKKTVVNTDWADNSINYTMIQKRHQNSPLYYGSIDAVVVTIT